MIAIPVQIGGHARLILFTPHGEDSPLQRLQQALDEGVLSVASFEIGFVAADEDKLRRALLPCEIIVPEAYDRARYETEFYPWMAMLRHPDMQPILEQLLQESRRRYASGEGETLPELLWGQDLLRAVEIARAHKGHKRLPTLDEEVLSRVCPALEQMLH